VSGAAPAPEPPGLGGYVSPERLGGTAAPAMPQRLQGDLLGGAAAAAVSSVAAILLTPTCDVALKADAGVRHLAPVTPLADDDLRPATWTGGQPPLHLCRLARCEPHWPGGALVAFRGTIAVAAATVEEAPRLASLDAVGLRQLLARHTTYWTRAAVAPEAIPLPPDDPRVLWAAVDAARAVPGLAARRHALVAALETAIVALARHHGIGVPSTRAAVLWLRRLTAVGVLPPATGAALERLGAIESTLDGLLDATPAMLGPQEAKFMAIAADLDAVAATLQARDPVQVTPQRLKAAGLANLLR
jgi:hypothetical protein